MAQTAQFTGGPTNNLALFEEMTNSLVSYFAVFRGGSAPLCEETAEGRAISR